MQAYILVPQGAHQAQTLKSDAKEDRREVRGNKHNKAREKVRNQTNEAPGHRARTMVRRAEQEMGKVHEAKVISGIPSQSRCRGWEKNPPQFCGRNQSLDERTMLKPLRQSQD